MNQNLILGLILLFALFVYLQNLGKEEPTQYEIQTLDHAMNKDKINNDFPYPQISRGFQKLGNQMISKPLDNLKNILPSGNDSIKIIRDTDSNIATNRMYLPDHYRKDRLSGDTTSSSELRPFNYNNEESEKSWTDENVSSYPNYYTSDIKDELTNIGMFFDKNNQYNDKTSHNTNVLTSDSCYEINDGQYFCEDNTRLQNIPPSLITDINKCEILNNIGVYKDKILKIPSNERTLNGGSFYNEVFASDKINEFPSETLKPLFGECIV
tara:strand:- start:1440 stop:2243 length:804 start_codon:yes stop_codon:yes gene_type:complete